MDCSSSSVSKTRARPNRLAQPAGHAVDAALDRDVLAEHQRLGVPGEQRRASARLTAGRGSAAPSSSGSLPPNARAVGAPAGGEAAGPAPRAGGRRGASGAMTAVGDAQLRLVEHLGRHRQHLRARRLVPVEHLVGARMPASTSSRAVPSERVARASRRAIARRRCGRPTSTSEPAWPISRTVRRCRNAGRRSLAHPCRPPRARRRQRRCQVAAVGARSTQAAAGSRRRRATQPGGVRTLIPMPLSSQTNSSGSGMPW